MASSSSLTALQRGLVRFYRCPSTARSLMMPRSYHLSPFFLQPETPEDGRKELVEKRIEMSKSMQVETFKVVGYNSLIDTFKQKEDVERKEQFSMALNEFVVREKYRKGHVQFIRIAMQRMDEFGLQKDLETYNRIIDIFPRGKFAPQRLLDSVWPRPIPQLELCLDVLTKMEVNGVRPSMETYEIVKAVFGKSLPLEKCVRIMYLFDKYRDMDPYEIRSELPTNPVELSRLALFRIAGMDGQLMEIEVPEIKGSREFIIGGHTTKQLQRLEKVERDGIAANSFLHVEGPQRIWLKRVKQYYYTLRVMDEQSDDKEGEVLGVCMCGARQQDGIRRWMGVLQEQYPSLAKANIIYDITELETPKSEEESSSDHREQPKLTASSS